MPLACQSKQLDFSVVMDKVEGPATVLIFLGLDSVLQQIRQPKTKLEEILTELTH